MLTADGGLDRYRDDDSTCKQTLKLKPCLRVTSLCLRQMSRMGSMATSDGVYS